MRDVFQSDLAALADRVENVDLTDRVRHTARRLRVARTTVAGIAALALAGGAAFGATALPGTSDVPAAASELDGRFIAKVYPEGEEFPDEPTIQDYSIATWAPGQEPEMIPLAEKAYGETDEISRDGELLSYVGEDKKVHVVDLLAGEEIELPDVPQLRDIEPNGGSLSAVPTWAPDSKRLWLQTPDGPYGFVDITSGEFTETVATDYWWSVRVVRGENGEDRLIGTRNEGEVNQLVETQAYDTESEPRVVGSGDDLSGGETGQFDAIATADMDGSRLCLDNGYDGPAEPGAPTDTLNCDMTTKLDPESGEYQLELSDMPMVDIIEGDEDLVLLHPGDEPGDTHSLADAEGNILDEVSVPSEMNSDRSWVIGYDANP